MENNIRQTLELLAEQKYRDFNSSIAKNEHPMIGVRIPKLREIAKQIAKTDAYNFLNNNQLYYYEEILLQGFVIGYLKDSDDKKYQLANDYIQLIKDWSECDCVIATFKFMKNDIAKTYNMALQLCDSTQQFVRRSGIVILMDYCLGEEYIQKSLNILLNIKSNDYYVNMAVAWALSVCFVKNFDMTLNQFKGCDLDKFTYNKTIQKCIESFRITSQQKSMLRKMKK